MVPGLNVFLQTVAVLVFCWLRLTTGGWTTVAMVFTGGPIFMLLPLVLAIIMARRERRLSGWTTAACCGTAASLMVAGGLISDQDDYEGWMFPIFTVLGKGRVMDSDSPWMVLDTIGWSALLACLVCFIASGVLAASPRGYAKPWWSDVKPEHHS